MKGLFMTNKNKDEFRNVFRDELRRRRRKEWLMAPLYYSIFFLILGTAGWLIHNAPGWVCLVIFGLACWASYKWTVRKGERR